MWDLHDAAAPISVGIAHSNPNPNPDPDPNSNPNPNPNQVSGAHNGVRAFKISGRTDGCASLLDPVSSYYSQARSHLLTTHLLRSASDPRLGVRMQVGQADSSPTPSPNP